MLKELLHKLHPKLKSMGGGVKGRKNALVKALHHTISMINREERWDLPAKLVFFMPRRLAAVKLVKGKQTKY